MGSMRVQGEEGMGLAAAQTGEWRLHEGAPLISPPAIHEVLRGYLHGSSKGMQKWVGQILLLHGGMWLCSCLNGVKAPCMHA